MYYSTKRQGFLVDQVSASIALGFTVMLIINIIIPSPRSGIRFQDHYRVARNRCTAGPGVQDTKRSARIAWLGTQRDRKGQHRNGRRNGRI